MSDQFPKLTPQDVLDRMRELDPERFDELDERVVRKKLAEDLPKIDAKFKQFDTEYRPSLLTRIFGSIFGLITIILYWCFAAWWWKKARATDLGIEVSSKVRGVIAHYPWSQIAAMRKVGHGAITCPELTLTNGKTVLLHMAEWDELAPVVTANGILTENPWQ